MRGAPVRSAVEMGRVLAVLLRASFDVRWRAPGALLRTCPGEGTPRAPPGGDERERAARMAHLVAWVADRPPFRCSCLVRALALHRLLDWVGLSGSVLRIGVRRDVGGAVAAHAWVVYGGTALGDARATSFTRLTDVRAPGRP